MDPIRLGAEKFLQVRDSMPIADVRTPLEYTNGHIPGSHLFPIFSNEERAEIGKLYALNGNDSAIERGYEIAGPKLSQYLKEALKIAPNKVLSIYCWRGGMRSASLAWLLGFSGFKVTILEGGYKAYRQYCRESLSKPSSIILIGGFTGAGKSEILDFLQVKGEQVIKLERLANHKGSAFGAIGEENQPSQQQFENMLSECWLDFDSRKTIWIEDESINIGKLQIPRELFSQMEKAPVFVLENERDLRISRLVHDYEISGNEALIEAFRMISKRIGKKNYISAIDALKRNEMNIAAEIALNYYDKAYAEKLNNRNSSSLFNFNFQDNMEDLADSLIQLRNKIKSI